MSYPIHVANKLLDDLSINSPEDLQFLKEIAWERGAYVRDAPLKSADARLDIFPKQAVITISTRLNNPQRKRFSIAHELGHLELHRLQTALSVCFADDIDDKETKIDGKQLESEANEFASALLLPEGLFKPICNQDDPSLDYVQQLAEVFNTSLTATALRFAKFSYDPIAIVYSESSRIKWVYRNNELEQMRLFIHGKRKLDSNSLAASKSQKSKHVRADIWFDEGDFDKHSKIVEHSWQMPVYDGVLTLLWVDEDITDVDDW